MMKNLIIISGIDGAGKSTLARTLYRRIRCSGILPMAESLRRELSKVVPKEEIKMLWEKPTAPHHRELLMKHSTDNRNKYGDSYYVLEWLKLRERELPRTVTVIIDDARFPCEFVGLRNKVDNSYHIHIHKEPSESQTGAYYSTLNGEAGSVCDLLLKWQPCFSHLHHSHTQHLVDLFDSYPVRN